jgi:transcriptional regulator with XRE-family HTH domain
MVAVGAYLRELRDAKGWSRLRAATEGKVSTKSIERWEDGEVEPAFTDLAAYVRALNGSIARALNLLLGEDATASTAMVAELAEEERARPLGTPEEEDRFNRLLTLLESGVPPAEAARRARHGR